MKFLLEVHGGKGEGINEEPRGALFLVTSTSYVNKLGSFRHVLFLTSGSLTQLIALDGQSEAWLKSIIDSTDQYLLSTLLSDSPTITSLPILLSTLLSDGQQCGVPGQPETRISNTAPRTYSTRVPLLEPR